jgi:DNA-binding transcriptional MerR regulator
MQNADCSIQAMAARCGMTEHTLRYYERVGLIRPVRREQNGHRRYSDQDENWLNLLKSMRATQMPIRELRRYASLREAGDNCADAQRKILERHRAALESRIADLQDARALLTQKLDALPKLSERDADVASEPVSQPAD